MMKKIQLTKGQFALVDDEDFEYINSFHWQAISTRLKDGFYATRNNGFDKKGSRLKIRMHREIMKAKDGETVDHINGNTLDNRKSNLRLCSQKQNVWNQRPRRHAQSNHRGLNQLPSGNWRARITKDGQRTSLGTFSTELEAAAAYDKAAKELFGKFYSRRDKEV